MNKLYILMALMLLGAHAAISQQVPISRAEALGRFAESNRDLLISEAAYREARGNYRQTQSVFLPRISASHTALVTTNPLMAFGSKLNQEILTPADFDPALLNDPEPIENFATRLEIQQPLVNVDGFFQRRAAKFQMEAAALKSKRGREFLELETTRAYMEMQVAHRGVAVLEKALETARANERLAASNFRQGYLQKSDLLAVQVRVGEIRNQLKTAQSLVSNSSDYLSQLMGETPAVIYAPKDSLLPWIAPESLETELSDDRADLRARELASEAYRNAYRADRSAFLPRLNAFGSYELYDDELLQFGADGYTLGASLSWELFDGGKRFGKAQTSKASYEKARFENEQYRSESLLELRKARRALADARANLEVTQLALEQSREALRIRTNRFREGLEKTTDLLSSETAASRKELDYLQSIYQYNYALAYLRFLVSGRTEMSPGALNR